MKLARLVKNPWWRVVGLSCAIGLAATASAFAQGGASTGTMTGKIADDTGAMLPGVTVTLTNLATNQSRSTVTNDEGLYRFGALQPAKYSLTAELAGFATYARPEITVNVGAAVDLDVMMRVSSVEETVTVTGEAPIVERGTDRPEHAHHQGTDRDAAEQQSQLPRLHAAHAGDGGEHRARRRRASA